MDAAVPVNLSEDETDIAVQDDLSEEEKALHRRLFKKKREAEASKRYRQRSKQKDHKAWLEKGVKRVAKYRLEKRGQKMKPGMAWVSAKSGRAADDRTTVLKSEEGKYVTKTQEMAQFDRLGRHRKQYLPRHDPFKTWREEKFISKYRLCTERVKWLAEQYGRSGCSRTQGTDAGGGLSYEQQMTVALRYLATGANLSIIAELHQVAAATVSRCVEDVTHFFYRYSNSFIHWPHTVEAKVSVAEGFYKKNNQKHLVLGCVDGTHVQIISPCRDREAVFVNRKGFHSLNVMVVCDSAKMITHLDPCWAGSAQDSYVFNCSPLKEEVKAGRWGDFFLLGDNGYRLHKNLLTPYLHPVVGHETGYNIWHKSTQSIVERTIGALKQRWRCLDQNGGYLRYTPEKSARIITACGCLHNLAILDRTPHLDHQDDDAAAFVLRMDPVVQPQELKRETATDTCRDAYAKTWFALPDPVVEEIQGN